MKDCILCGYEEPKASKDAAYVICSRCTCSLMLMSRDKRAEMHDTFITKGFPEKAQALKENFTLGDTKLIDLIPLIKAKGLRAIAREVGVHHRAVQYWVQKGKIPRVYVDSVKKALDQVGVR